MTGMLETYRGAKDKRRGMAAVQQNLTYRRELHAGETVAVRSAFIEVRDKLAKFVHEMRNGAGEISAVCVLTAVHIDSDARKSCPFPSEIAERARRGLIREYELPS
jgi:acyl-CoA thioester hydrolase